MELNYKELNQIMHRYLPEGDIEEVYEAYLFAREAHSGQVRKSGEPYIIHPVAATIVLAEQKLPKKVLISGLLHDVIEDTKYTHEDIAERFGSDIAEIVEGVTKLGNIQGLTNDQVQAANHHKIILAAAKDIRVILVKLADRVHNMRTIKHMRDEKKKIIATETLEVYAPIAHRLGMYRIKWELEDLSFKCINRKAYDDIAAKLQMKRSERDNIVNKITIDAMNLLDENGVDAKIYGRSKSIYSIYQKIKKSGKDFDDLTDLFAFRVIVNTIPECYQVLGIVHENYKPIPMRFKDYIPTPKHNMYQSIHTTVLTQWGIPIEFQIRTNEMDRTAEYGIASHWMYKSDVESEVLQNDVNQKVDLLRHAFEAGEDSNAEAFMDAIKLDYFSKNLIVYTPKGDVIELPEESCVLDFAYYIHTNIGNKAVSATVNDKVVSVFHKLQIGDVVHVITSSLAEPSISSIHKVKTSRAKESLKKYFKNEEKNSIRSEGRKIIREFAKEKGIKNIEETITQENMMERLNREFSISSLDEFYYEIGMGEVNLNSLIDYINNEEKAPLPKTNELEIEDLESPINYRLCRYCSPLPGDEIYAIKNEQNRFIDEYFIHREGCHETGDHHKAHWENGAKSREYASRISISILDKKHSMLTLLKTISEFNKNITSVYLRANVGDEAVGRISMELKSVEEFAMIRKALLELDNVNEVKRIIDGKHNENS